ncbi:MAG: glyoxalase/bleomycin resistance protein/dioxygenase [Acidobacteria bacterium]|nr:glyoxalase/bleomycin resistance protein/dioxygenase [Acidobacteriota bacterium]
MALNAHASPGSPAGQSRWAGLTACVTKKKMQTIFPILRYNDARAAISWLCAAFGFKEIFCVPETGLFVRHAQLSLGTNLIMLGSCRQDEPGLASPQTLGASTQALCVYVPDVDEHFERAHLAGAEITAPPLDTDFGSREYHARDLEGHMWTFGNYLPDVESGG